MKHWTRIFRLSSILAVCMWPAASPAETVKIRNEKVVVLEDRLAPGETRTLKGDFPSVVVYPGSGKVEISPTGGNVQNVLVRPGQTTFEAAQPRTVKNTGTGELTLVRVVFITKGSPEMMGPEGLSPNYKLLFENAFTRTYEIKIPAGTNEPQHTHKDRVVICLSGAQMEHLMPDGKREPSTLKTGEVAYRKGATHIGHNLGKTDLWVIAVEPK